jgi:hypothetical protein
MTQHLAKLGVLNESANRFDMNYSPKRRKTSLFPVIGLFFCGGILFQSCTQFWRFSEPVPGTLRLDARLEWAGEATQLGEITEDHLGHSIRLDNVQMYFSDVELRSENGDWRSVGGVSLIDFSVPAPRLLVPVPSGIYDAIRFGMGIPADINTNLDPASYPNDHPLSVLGSAGMFWTWASGYVFVKYEGKYAEESDEQPLEPLSYHCGTDDSYRTVTLDFDEPILIESRQLTEYQLVLDAAAVLLGTDDSIDISIDPVTHNGSGTILGGRIMDLLDDAWTLRP